MDWQNALVLFAAATLGGAVNAVAGGGTLLTFPALLWAHQLEIVAIPLVVNSYYTAIFAIGAFVPALLVRWRYEERELVRKFGDVYVQYQREVGAFFPNPRTRRRGPGRDASAP